MRELYTWRAGGLGRVFFFLFVVMDCVMHGWVVFNIYNKLEV